MVDKDITQFADQVYGSIVPANGKFSRGKSARPLLIPGQDYSPWAIEHL